MSVKGGLELKRIREQLGLTLRDVDLASQRLAEERKNRAYFVSSARLCQIENNGSLPSLYKLASLSEIYGVPYETLLLAYDIETHVPPGSRPCPLP